MSNTKLVPTWSEKMTSSVMILNGGNQMTEQCTQYLRRWAAELKCTFHPSPRQIQKMADTQVAENLYVCPCKVYGPGITDGEDIYCPCAEGIKNLAEGKKCHCGIFVPEGME